MCIRDSPEGVPKTQKVTKEVVENLTEWFRTHPQGWSIPAGVGMGAVGASKMGGIAEGAREQ